MLLIFLIMSVLQSIIVQSRIICDINSTCILFFQGMSDLPDYHKITFPENPPIPLEQLLPDASSTALDLLGKFLVYPSKQRISAEKASFVFDTTFEPSYNQFIIIN